MFGLRGFEMRKQKKILAALLAAGLLLAGCGSGNGEKEQDSSQEAQTTEETPTPQEEPAKEETSGENVEEDSEDQEEKVEISIPEQEGLVADYTTVEGLTLEAGTQFAVVVTNTESGYWKAVREGISQAVDDLNEMLGYEGSDKIQFIYDAPKDETGVNEQVDILDSVLTEAALAGKPYVLCLAAVDMSSCEAQLETASMNQIPVIILDSGVESDLVNASCVTDNYGAGQEAAKRLCEQIGDNGEIAVAAHTSLSATSQQRVQGFTDEITANHPNVSLMQVSYEPSGEEELSLEEQIRQVLDTYPNLKGYFATNEEVSEQLLSILEDYQDRQIKMVGFDVGKDQIDAIREGREAGVVCQNPYGMGYATVVAGARALMNLENSAVINTGYQWIDQSTIDLEENQKYIYE